VLPHIGAERLQRLDEPQLRQLYGKLLAEGGAERDHNGEMYTFWSTQTTLGTVLELGHSNPGDTGVNIL
jgi:hypothetical protein